MYGVTTGLNDPGVRPTFRAKLWFMWLWLLKPQSTDTCASGRPVAMNLIAAYTRIRDTYFIGGSPKVILKLRAKWNRLSAATLAISETVIFSPSRP